MRILLKDHSIVLIAVMLIVESTQQLEHLLFHQVGVLTTVKITIGEFVGLRMVTGVAIPQPQDFSFQP